MLYGREVGVFQHGMLQLNLLLPFNMKWGREQTKYVFKPAVDIWV